MKDLWLGGGLALIAKFKDSQSGRWREKDYQVGAKLFKREIATAFVD